MRFGQVIVAAAAGLALFVAFDRVGAIADGNGASKTTGGKVRQSPEAPKPVVNSDITQLPVGKTIGLVPGDLRVLKALNEPAEFSMVDKELGEFVKQVAENHKISVQLDIAALTADGKGTETILNKTTKETTLRSALHLFLDEHGLTHVVENETLLITTKTAAETKTPARIYQVHDLTLLPNDPTLQPRFDALRDLLQATILPESWRENGGTQGEIAGYEGAGLAVLVITQTDEGHEQIERLLAELRAAKLPALFEMQKKRPPPTVPVPTATVPTATRPSFSGGSIGVGGGFSGGGFIGAGGS